MFNDNQFFQDEPLPINNDNSINITPNSLSLLEAEIAQEEMKLLQNGGGGEGVEEEQQQQQNADGGVGEVSDQDGMLIEEKKKKKKGALIRKNGRFFTQDKQKNTNEDPVKKTQRRRWGYNTHKLTFINPPTQILNNDIKSSYQITFGYTDENDKQHTKTIKFGLKDRKEFVDDKDQEKRDKTVKRLCDTQNPFNKNFWRYNILSVGTDISANYCILLRKLTSGNL